MRQAFYANIPSVEVGKEDNFVCVGRAESRKPCSRLVLSTGVGMQEPEAPGRMCYDTPIFVNRVVIGQLSNEVENRVAVTISR